MLNEKHWNLILKALLSNPEMPTFKDEDQLVMCPDTWYTFIAPQAECPLHFQRVLGVSPRQREVVGKIPEISCELTGIYKNRAGGRKHEMLAELKNEQGVILCVQNQILKLFPENRYNYFNDGQLNPVYIVDKFDDELNAVIMPYKG